MARRNVVRGAARAAMALSPGLRRQLANELVNRDPEAVVEALRPMLSREPRLGSMPLDLAPSGSLEFEDLAGLFASSALNHGIVGMTIRQVAYVFGLARRSGAKRAIEIGRWRGGSTVALAAGMGPEGKVWSIDLRDKESRVLGLEPGTLDAETQAFCKRFGLDVELLVGDSRTIEVETGDVDLVLIDGDHTYEGVKADFDRFGRRVPVGGAVLLDDAFDGPFMPAHPESAGRVVREVTADGDYVLERAVDRLAHLRRVS